MKVLKVELIIATTKDPDDKGKEGMLKDIAGATQYYLEEKYGKDLSLISAKLLGADINTSELLEDIIGKIHKDIEDRNLGNKH